METSEVGLQPQSSQSVGARAGLCVHKGDIMSLGLYILSEDGTPELAENAILWADWFESDDRKVAQTQLSNEVTVSTVFLGINQNFGGEGLPILWETRVFGGTLDGKVKMYASEKEALVGHKRMVDRMKETP